MKIVRDLVHGYIEIDDLERQIIDTPSMQRLKDIRQLTAQQAYPSANHTRFEHSLGVLYLSRKAFYNLRILLGNTYGINSETFQKMMRHLRIAALLHDVGHAPFSHLGEKYYRKDEIRSKIKEVVKSKNLDINIDIFNQGSSHEIMSCYVIVKNFSELIFNMDATIDIELICRAIVGARFSQEDKWLENIVIDLINSETVDTDKLDYLMRDAVMTGVNVPAIDTTRLFRNIFVNPNLKTITFKDKAIPVLQNIIDARDSMYLWAYNHHIAVYTDFVLEFYLKHLAINEEKGNEVEDTIKLEEFFSCAAISDFLRSDSDLRSLLKSPISQSKCKVSDYTKNILPQIFERKFLKPLWKTVYEYNNFIKTNVPDSRLVRDLEKKMCDSNYVYRRYVVKTLIKECGLSLGEIFIVPRSNKFYSLNPNKSIFNVYVDSGDKDLRELLPQKNFLEMYSNVNFYVFGEESKLNLIKEKFIQLIKKPIPDQGSLPDDGVYLDWFKEQF